MKVVPPKDVSKSVSKIILPLIDDPEEDQLDKTNSVSYELRSSPANNDSPKYKVLVRVLKGGESPRASIKWRQDVDKVITGLNITTYTNKKAIAETLMNPATKATFGAALTVQAQAAYQVALEGAARAAVEANGVDHYRHVDHITVALNTVLASILPAKILARVKRSLRREMRKPIGMKVRAYYNNLVRINLEEVVRLPPFDPAQSLSDDELIDIILYGTPKSWEREMDRQGFDPMVKTLPDVVDFLEQIENAEAFDAQNSKVESKKKSSSSNGNSKSKDKDSKGSKYCLVHGNCSHTSEECTVLQREAKKLKEDHSSSSNGKSNGNYSNKTWKRNANEASAQTKNDLKALVKRQVCMTVKELKAADKKKRKSSDDDSSLEANAVELEDFNYNDISNLSLSDKEDSDEVSV